MRKTFRFVILVGCLLMFSGTMAAAQTAIPDTPELRMARAQELEQSGDLKSQPDKLRELAMIHAVIAGLDISTLEATKKAIGFLEKAEKANPGDYELMAAHGSVLTMMAQYQKKTSQQLRYTKKGFRKMDRALKKDPNNVGALLQRANNSLHMPAFLKRTHYAKRDFLKVLELVDDRKGAGFKAMVLYQLGLAYELMKDADAAEKQWQMAGHLKSGYWSDKALEKLN